MNCRPVRPYAVDVVSLIDRRRNSDWISLLSADGECRSVFAPTSFRLLHVDDASDSITIHTAAAAAAAARDSKF